MFATRVFTCRSRGPWPIPQLVIVRRPISRLLISCVSLFVYSWSARIERSARGLVPTAVAPAGCKSMTHCEHRYIIGPQGNSCEAVYEDLRHICLSSSRKAGLTTMPARPCNQLPTSQPTGQPGNRPTSRPISRPASPTQPLSHATHQPPSQPAIFLTNQNQ